MRGSVLLGMAALSATVGAARLTGPRPPYTLRTDARAYRAAVRYRYPDWNDYAFRVVARFRNGSRAPAYLELCSPPAPPPAYSVAPVDTGGPRVSRYVTICPRRGFYPQRAVAPGAERVDTLLLRWPGDADGATHKPWGTPAGRFRLVYHVMPCLDEDACRRLHRAGADSVRWDLFVSSGAFAVQPDP